jgi:hypothetical protein
MSKEFPITIVGENGLCSKNKTAQYFAYLLSAIQVPIPGNPRHLLS